MLNAIIFDIDGTLIDSVDFHAKAWQETFERYGVHVSFEDVRWQIGKGGDQLMPVFLSKELLESKGEEIQKERGEHFKKKYLPLVKPFPLVRELFQKIKGAGIRIALASSGSEEEVKQYKEIANVADLLESHTSADDAERSKPHPDIFLAALGTLGHPEKDKVMVVGDTPYDAEAAQKAGLRTVGVLCGGFPADVLSKAGCIAVYNSPADLLTHFETSPLGR